MSLADTPFRQPCPGCQRNLKIRVEELPSKDFNVACPKCGTQVLVRAAAVRAVLSKPDAPMAAAASDGGARVPEDGSGFGAQDLTAQILEQSRSHSHSISRPRASVPSLDPAMPERSSVSGSRALPRNSPRTTPPPRTAADLPWPLIGGVGGGIVALVLVFVLVSALSHHKPKDPLGVEDDQAVSGDVKAIVARYPGGAGDTAENLFHQALDKMKGDSSAEHRDAADLFRRAVVAQPGHPEPMAALALNALFLPHSERDGIGVTQANVWADYVQRKMPDSPLGGIARGALLASLDQQDQATALVSGVLAKHPESALALFVLGHIEREKDPRAAAASFHHALSIDPTWRIAASELALADLAAGRPHDAAAALEQRKNMGGASALSLRAAAELARRLGDPASAKSDVEQAVQLEPKDVDARLDLGWRLAGAGDLAGARDAASHVLSVDQPAGDATDAQSADAKLLLCDVSRREGKIPEAIANGKAALPDHKEPARVRYVYALALIAGHRYDQAADVLKEAQAKDSSHLEIPMALGEALFGGTRVDDAVAAYQQVLAMDPSNVIAHARLGILYVEAQLPAKAQDEWEHMIAGAAPLAPLIRQPDGRWPSVPFDLNRAILGMREVERADPNRDVRYRVYEIAMTFEAGRVADAFKAASMLRGIDAEQACYLAGWYLWAGRPNDAVKLTARVETPAQMAVRGWALRAARNPQAERVLQATLLQDSEEPYANLGLAQMFIQRGQGAKAATMLRIAQAKLGDAPAVAKAMFEATSAD